MNSLILAVTALAVISTATGAKLPNKKRGIEEFLGYHQLLDTSFGPANSYEPVLKELSSPLTRNNLHISEIGLQDNSLHLRNAGNIALPYILYGNQQTAAPQPSPAVQSPPPVSMAKATTATSSRPNVADAQMPPQQQSQPIVQEVPAPSNPVTPASAPAPTQAAVSAQPSVAAPAVASASATITLQLPAQLQQLQPLQMPVMQSIAQPVNNQQVQSVQGSAQSSSQQAQPVAPASPPVNPKQNQVLQMIAPSSQATAAAISTPAAVSTPVANSQLNQIAPNVQYLPWNQAPEGQQQSIVTFPQPNAYTQQQLYYKPVDVQTYPSNQHLGGLQQLSMIQQKALLDAEGYIFNVNSGFSELKLHKGGDHLLY